jgi:hypothetical protein
MPWKPQKIAGLFFSDPTLVDLGYLPRRFGMTRVIRIPVKVTQQVKAGSMTIRCSCGALVRPGRTHTCSKTYR